MSNENILLQTLGFDVAIDHPHTHVVKCCQLVKGVLSFHIFHNLDLNLATSFLLPYLWTTCDACIYFEALCLSLNLIKNHVL